jgi:hypothetical protein
MRKLTAREATAFREQGFAVIEGYFATTRFLDDIVEEIVALGRIFESNFDLSTAAQQINSFTAAARSSFYSGLRYLPSLARLASSELLVQTSHDLGLEFPAVMRSSNIRMDMPQDAKHLFHWHQDITYLLGSLNSVTYWIPFDRVNRASGTVEVVGGSHRHGVAPVRYTPGGEPPVFKSMSPKDLVLLHEPEQPGVAIEAERGDLVVLSQLVMHRSVPNSGNRVRWTAQIRHADLAEPEFVAAGYPWGDATNLFHARYLPEMVAK